MSELEGRGVAWTEEQASGEQSASEPPGRGAAGPRKRAGDQ